MSILPHLRLRRGAVGEQGEARRVAVDLAGVRAVHELGVQAQGVAGGRAEEGAVQPEALRGGGR